MSTELSREELLNHIEQEAYDYEVVARASRLAAEFILEQWERSQETAH
ncbi:MAG: hypothetical protein ACOC6A_00460 [Chloroflexota bacterium]